MQEIKVCLHKKGAHMLVRTIDGKWFLDDREVDWETAIQEMATAVEELGYWCQVAKDILLEEDFAEVQRAYEYHAEEV